MSTRSRHSYADGVPHQAQPAHLYTPELLSLAVTLGSYPYTKSHSLHGEARSRTCGSIVALSLEVDCDKRVADVGLRVSACAVGQAAAAIFARGVVGFPTSTLAGEHNALVQWLSGRSALPTWPGMEALTSVLLHRGRHQSVLLPWIAAIAALNSA